MRRLPVEFDKRSPGHERPGLRSKADPDDATLIEPVEVTVA
jgi:hypothetical protein